MKQTAVEWLYEELDNYHKMKSKFRSKKAILEKAKQMEKEQSHEYAEFAIRCDRKDMKILNFEDWIKLETFKSE